MERKEKRKQCRQLRWHAVWRRRQDAKKVAVAVAVEVEVEAPPPFKSRRHRYGEVSAVEERNNTLHQNTRRTFTRY